MAMDTILDVFFEKVFSQLPRGALLSRYKRAELSDYFGTVIVGCVGGEQVSATNPLTKSASNHRQTSPYCQQVVQPDGVTKSIRDTTKCVG